MGSLNWPLVNLHRHGTEMVNRDIVNMSNDSEGKEPDQRNTLHDEIIEYHFEYKPDKSADIIYNRIENSG